MLIILQTKGRHARLAHGALQKVNGLLTNDVECRRQRESKTLMRYGHPRMACLRPHCKQWTHAIGDERLEELGRKEMSRFYWKQI